MGTHNSTVDHSNIPHKIRVSGMLTASTTAADLRAGFFFDTDVQVEQQKADAGAEVMNESPEQAGQTTFDRQHSQKRLEGAKLSGESGWHRKKPEHQWQTEKQTCTADAMKN
jgi:hypothetical protein